MRPAALLATLALVLPLFGPAPGAAAAAEEREFLDGVIARNVGPFRGGRATVAVGVRQNPHVYYMGTTGGVWKTENAGASWNPVSDDDFGTAFDSERRSRARDAVAIERWAGRVEPRPEDLAGIVEQLEAHNAALDEMIKTALKMGIAPRAEIGSADGAKKFLDMGVKHFCMGTDVSILMQWFGQEGDAMRKTLEGA